MYEQRWRTGRWKGWDDDGKWGSSPGMFFFILLLNLLISTYTTPMTMTMMTHHHQNQHHHNVRMMADDNGQQGDRREETMTMTMNRAQDVSASWAQVCFYLFNSLSFNFTNNYLQCTYETGTETTTTTPTPPTPLPPWQTGTPPLPMTPLPPLHGYPPYRGLIYFEGNVGFPDTMCVKGPNDDKLLFGPLGIFKIMIFVI